MFRATNLPADQVQSEPNIGLHKPTFNVENTLFK